MSTTFMFVLSVMLGWRRLAWVTCYLVSLLVYAANAGSVDTVLCDGKILMEKKELRTLDAERILFEAERCAMRHRLVNGQFAD